MSCFFYFFYIYSTWFWYILFVFLLFYFFLYVFFFFFFKQKTAYEMRISDWSSDVCSSDLTSTVSPTAPVASVVTPYLTIAGAAEALDWYTEALGAVEAFRVVGDDGRIGHSELSIGGARVMISDDYPEIGVHSPASLNGTTVALHLEVGDVDDLFARAVAAGATSLQEPADQAHGARHGTDRKSTRLNYSN